MRKLNNLLAILIFVLFIAHGITKSLLLIGVINKPIKVLSYFLLIVVVVHGLIGMYETRKCFRNKKWYLKEDLSYWIKRISGLTILILICFRVGAYGGMIDKYYKYFYEGCGQSFSCKNICPMKLPLDEIQVRANRFK